MRPLYAGYASWGFMKDEYAVVVTFGLSLLLINLVDKTVGPYSFRGPPLVDIGRFALGPVMLTGQKAIAALVAVALMVGLALFIKRSVWGLQIQAVAQNRLGASLAGIDATRTTSLIFVISGALAALVGRAARAAGQPVARRRRVPGDQVVRDRRARRHGLDLGRDDRGADPRRQPRRSSRSTSPTTTAMPSA